MLPEIGGLELLVIAAVALIVVGPKDLPVMLRKLGQFTAKIRGMANEFRASFDEMARQSELDELRKEVEALRTGQGMVPLGAEADAAFREIRDDLNRPLDEPVMLAAPDEWPDSPPVMTPLESEPAQAPKAKARSAAKPLTAPTKAAAPVASIKTAIGKPRPIRAKKVDL